VAEVEPAGIAEALELVDDGESVAGEAPAGLRAHRAGERVDDDVRVGRDVEAEHLDVVARVRDDGYVARIGGGGQALEETGGAAAPGEDGIHAANCGRRGG